MALNVLATGIEFTPQGGSSVNLLDDYEEGTWTPVLGKATGGTISTSGSIVISSNNYTKIGNIVIVNCYIDMSGSGTITQGSSFAYVEGLPFNPAGNRIGIGSVGSNSAFTTTVVQSCFASPTNRLYFMPSTNTNTTVTSAWAVGYLSLSCSYRV